MATLLVLSHVRWDEGLHRPQQLLSRLARQYRVVFVDPPVYEGTSPCLERSRPWDNIVALRPHVPPNETGLEDDWLELLAPLLRSVIDEEPDHELAVWLSTPAGWPFVQQLEPSVVIYDCMDERWSTRRLSRPVRKREAALLRAAHVVLAGGPSLYRAGRRAHHNVHFVPSPLDAAHFAPDRVTARLDEYLAAERLQGHILAPRLGFFGLIDERIDLGLIGALARARPDWHIVMVGPVATPGLALPRGPNIHWLGEQPYRRLPALVAGWDVCLLPLARNEQSPFGGPAMALEYLSAEKPVVCTEVDDVAGVFGRVVRMARDPDAFVRACQDALRETPQRRVERLAQGAALVSCFSWDDAAQAVQQLLADALRRVVAPSPAFDEVSRTPDLPLHAP